VSLFYLNFIPKFIVMRFLTFLLVVFLGLQTAFTQQALQLTKVMELKMTGDGGSNGASVAWHSVGKKYYAAMAGNASYPLCVFDSKGSLLSPSDNAALVDVRGLWFNAKKAKIQGNAFGEDGWFEYTLNADGIPTDFKKMIEGASQPDDQCVGTFSSKTNEVIFFDGMDIYFYDALTGEVKESLSFEEVLKKSGISLSEKGNYNDRSILFTAKPGQEIGLVNVEKKQIELFSLDGKLSLILKIPQSQEVYPSFNVAYANGMYWLFDKDSRKWIGYKEGGTASSTSTLTPVPTSGSRGAYGELSKIIKVGDLYSTFNIAGTYPDKEAEWNSEFGEATTKEILKRSDEKGWPSSISTLSGRDEYRDRFVDFNCYRIADLGTDYVVLWIPMSENKHMPSALIAPYDYYMVYNRSAVQLGDKVKPRFSASGSGGTLTGAGTKPATGSQGRVTKITDPGDLYSTYNLEEDESGVAAVLKQEYGEAGAAEIFKRAKESGWPYGISDFTRRSEYRERFIEYTTYYIANVGADKALLWVPMNKNTGVPSAMQGENDIFFVYAKKGLSLGDKVKANVVISNDKQDNRTKPVTGTLGGSKPAASNNNTKTTSVATGNFQAQIETLVKSYAGNFSSIKGKKMDKGTYDIFEKWETSVKLAGSMDSYLSDGILNEHLEYVAEFGTNYSKQSANSKLNALVAEVLKAKPAGVSMVKEELSNKESAVIQYFIAGSSAPKAYDYFIMELGMYKSSSGSDTWSIELRIYSEEEE
jgi:hypothetical protein